MALPSQPARPQGHRWGWLVLLGLCAYGVFFIWQLRDFGFEPGDEGVATMGAWRILEGEIPHRDFFEIVPPFSFLPTVLAFKILGVGLQAERWVVMIYAVLMIIGTERLLARYSASLLCRSACVAFLLPFGVFYWPMPSHHWVVNILQLFALLALLAGAEARRVGAWGLAAGVLSSLACFSLQDQGAYLVLALCLFFFPWIGERRVRQRLFLGWAVGGLATAAVFAVSLLPHVSLAELAHQWVTFPAERYKLLPGNESGFARGLELIGSERWRGLVRDFPVYTISWTALACFLIALPVLAAGVLVAAVRGRWARPERLGLLVAGTVAFVGTSLHRYSLQNVCWAAPLPLVVVLWATSRGERSGRRWLQVSAAALAAAITLLSVGYAQSRVALAAEERTLAVSGRAGSLRFYRQPHAAGTQLILSSVERLVPPGAPLFCTGFNALLNFWTLSPNPTRFNFFVYPQYHTREQMEEVKRALKRRPDSHVLLLQPFQLDNEFGAFLEEEYRPVWSTSYARLLARRAAEDG